MMKRGIKASSMFVEKERTNFVFGILDVTKSYVQLLTFPCFIHYIGFVLAPFEQIHFFRI